MYFHFTQHPNFLGIEVVQDYCFCDVRPVPVFLLATPTEVTVVYQNGLPVISVSLPSRRERCQFTLKPLSDCVGVFLQQLQAEDRGIDRVAIYSMGMLTHTSEQNLITFSSSTFLLRKPSLISSPFLFLFRWGEGCLLHRNRHPAAG